MADRDTGAAGDANEAFDYIIVGGGAAGCVLAGRLSEDPSVRVLLLEAGPDFRPGEEPARVSDARFRAHYDASLFTPFFMVQTTRDRKAPYRQPNLIGGGSSVNGLHAQRGVPDDYNVWSQHGVRGWSWADVLPYFRKLETDLDYPGGVHGDSGPIPISRRPEREWSGLSLAVRAASERAGVPRVADVNDGVGAGVGPVPLNARGLKRVSTATAYLTGPVRARPNLSIRGGSRVRRVVMDGRRAVGVELAAPSEGRVVRGREVILSSGVYQSPAILMRSGIGPAQALAACGIDVVADRPGVGARLRNHSQLSVTVHLRRAARQADGRRPPCAMVVRYTSEVAEAGEGDMLINLWERIPSALADDPLARQFAVFMPLINREFSEGSVSLNPADPFGPPQIDANTLGDPRDLSRIVGAMRRIAALLASPEVAPLVNEAFFARPTKIMQMLLAYDTRAKLVSHSGALALAGPDALRRRLLKGRGMTLSEALRDRATAEATAMQQVSPSGHGVATCTMGDPSDPMAVTDSRCRVLGVEGLRVVDGSIYPATMRAGAHLPIIMGAEKAAVMIAEDRRQPGPAFHKRSVAG